MKKLIPILLFIACCSISLQAQDYPPLPPNTPLPCPDRPGGICPSMPDPCNGVCIVAMLTDTPAPTPTPPSSDGNCTTGGPYQCDGSGTSGGGPRPNDPSTRPLRSRAMLLKAAYTGPVCDDGCSGYDTNGYGGVCLYNHFDCLSDPNNCGGIGRVCSATGATAICSQGNCFICTDEAGCLDTGGGGYVPEQNAQRSPRLIVVEGPAPCGASGRFCPTGQHCVDYTIGTCAPDDTQQPIGPGSSGGGQGGGGGGGWFRLNKLKCPKFRIVSSFPQP